MNRAKLVVMKFGGTSVANPERVMLAARKAAKAKKAGKKIVVVVSAPGGMTDDLLGLANNVHPKPAGRELDTLLAAGEQVSIALFALALESLGIRAVSLTGSQAGITTDGHFGAAEITAIRPEKIRKALRQNKVVVVAGFQGATKEGDIATLGRGGSDLTAIALAAALKAGHCEIYTDVEGVYTADPRDSSSVKKIRSISYDAMIKLAKTGAKVMQLKSLELARRHKVAIHVKCSFNNKEGTWIK
ncbi:MAG: aspartate kinase [Elusimicrobia bacterium]|nr:aspartate kinase [Elusimicrobiota bacterium]